jgi:outer membrane lipoprotein-sorting protein
MKNILIITITILTFFTTFSQNDTSAKKLLDDVSSNMRSYDNIYIVFDYILENKGADVEQVFEGDVILKGENYVVNLFDTTTIFDGEFSYTIVPENEEVNVVESNSENDESISPSSLLTFYKNGYTFSFGEKKNINGSQIQFVDLVPIDSNSEVISVKVGIDKKNLHIYSVREIGNNDTHTIIRVKELKTNQKLTQDTFTFDEEKYKNDSYTINR